jgi:hypothetical protein
MCLNKGVKPTLSEFQDRVHQRNLDHLTIWHNVGRDVEYGVWSIVGARMGTYMTMLTDWDYRLVQDFDALADIYATIDGHEPEIVLGRVADDLDGQLDLPINYLDERASAFFKHHYRSNWVNRGIMVTEMNVIREQEGW